MLILSGRGERGSSNRNWLLRFSIAPGLADLDGRLSRQLALGGMQVAFHGEACIVGVSFANCAVDLPVGLKGVLAVSCALRGLASLVVEGGRNRLHQRCQDRIAGCFSDSPMKADIVNQILCRVVDG